MKFQIGKLYLDRNGCEWRCVSPIFGSLPNFQSKGGIRIVQSSSGKYRWDDIEHERDMVQEVI